MSSDWKSLEPVPFPRFSNALGINPNEFAVFPFTDCQANKTGSNGVYKFNINKNEWIQMIKYDEDFESNDHSITIDKKTQSIYLCQENLSKIDLNTKKFKTLLTNTNLGTLPQILYINDSLHIIDSCDSNKHFIFGQQTETLQEIHQFDHKVKLWGHSLLYIKSKKCILLFVGRNSSEIHEFSLINNKWNKRDVKIPNNLSFQWSSIVTTKNDQYIFIFHAYDLDGIYIFDVRNNDFMKSNVKLPSNAAFHAIIMNDVVHDELLTFGFINQCFNSSQFIDTQLLPHYLIKLIKLWVCYEYIHILERAKGNHWKISVDSLLQSVLKKPL